VDNREQNSRYTPHNGLNRVKVALAQLLRHHLPGRGYYRTKLARTADLIYLGTFEGKFSPVGGVETDHGKVLFSLPLQLARLLKRVPPDSQVGVRYVSEDLTASGNTFKTFNVDVRRGTALLDVPEADAPADAATEPAPERRSGRTPAW
jgi:hypothetical protein